MPFLPLLLVASSAPIQVLHARLVHFFSEYRHVPVRKTSTSDIMFRKDMHSHMPRPQGVFRPKVHRMLHHVEMVDLVVSTTDAFGRHFAFVSVRSADKLDEGFAVDLVRSDTPRIEPSRTAEVAGGLVDGICAFFQTRIVPGERRTLGRWSVMVCCDMASRVDKDSRTSGRSCAECPSRAASARAPRSPQSPSTSH